ncbi:hypothetical protein HMPREF0239_05285 [Clostridium sp. ATCC BAA-442]|nr:hypothetical protein HMPREF0239_05285 [Clostridium sp. ATCC BAA-442]
MYLLPSSLIRKTIILYFPAFVKDRSPQVSTREGGYVTRREDFCQRKREEGERTARMVEFEGVNVERKEASAGSGRLFVEKRG